MRQAGTLINCYTLQQLSCHEQVKPSEHNVQIHFQENESINTCSKHKSKLIIRALQVATSVAVASTDCHWD